MSNNTLASAGIEGVVLQSQPSCLFLDTFYDRFLIKLYEQEPALQTATFRDQLQRILRTNNGDSDFYSSGLRACGWRAEQIVINSPWMQAAWAREHGTSASADQLIVEQVARIRPDIVYCQDMHQLSESVLREIKKHCKLLVGQIATSIIHLPIHCYDVIVSSILPIVEYCRSIGLTSFYVPLAFSPRVSAGLNLPSDFTLRPIECSFVGSIASEIHMKRAGFLNYLAERTSLMAWGVGVELLPENSVLRTRYQGQAWGPDLFTILGNSRITVNCHAEVLYDKENPKNSTDEFANNMRLFEATGMGALLMTEYRANLADLFEIGKEIVVYRSEDECAALIKYYLARPNEAKSIAEAGQARTLKDHSYMNRMADLSGYLKRLLTLRAIEQVPIDYSKISCDFRSAKATEITSGHTSAWQSPDIPARQRALVQKELNDMYRGEVAMPFRSLQAVLSRVLQSGDKILEIGCSSGYYFEVLSYLLPKKFSYTGVDYSEPMIRMARELYPETDFAVASGDALPYSEKVFDLVLSGGVLLHCPNYAEHIAETARVAKRSIVLTRTPVCKNMSTQYFTKKAYGIETVELMFNEAEVVNLVKEQGFRLTHYLVLDSDEANDRYTVTYAFQRVDA